MRAAEFPTAAASTEVGAQAADFPTVPLNGQSFQRKQAGGARLRCTQRPEGVRSGAFSAIEKGGQAKSYSSRGKASVSSGAARSGGGGGIARRGRGAERVVAAGVVGIINQRFFMFQMS